MKKSLLALAAGVALTAASADAATVYFENTDNWPSVAAWTWVDGGVGSESSTKEVTIDDHTLYKVETEDNNVIFKTAGSWDKKSADLKVVDNAVYGPNSVSPIAKIVNGQWVAEAEDEYPAMYLVGALPNASWTASADYKMSTADGVTYTWSGEIPAEVEFKFFGGAWQTRELTGAGSNLANGEYNLTSGVSNMSLKTGGNVTFTLVQSDNFASATLTIAGQEEGGGDDPVDGNVLYLMGDFKGSWSLNSGIVMKETAVNSGIYTCSLQRSEITTTSENIYFRIFEMDDTWNGVQYGTGEGNVEVTFNVNGQWSGKAVKGQGEQGNWYFKKADLDEGKPFEVEFNINTLELSFGKEIVSAVETIEAANGEAVYFNLQGVRVANPENGLYIRVQNGKAVKVVK